MKYERFEQLPVWNAAIDLAVRIYALTEDAGFACTGDLVDQLKRASLSISNNIAEGFERGTTSELLQFLYYARGSAGEVRSMLCFCEKLLQEGAPPQSGTVASQLSNLDSRISNSKSQSPDSTSQSSNSTSRSSNATSQSSNSTSQTSNATSQTSNATSQSSDSTSQISNSKSQSSSLKSRSSNLKSRSSNLKSQISDLKSLAESCSRQIRGWADSLQNSDITGQRNLNDKSRAAFDHNRRASAFMRQIDDVVQARIAEQVAAGREKPNDAQ